MTILRIPVHNVICQSYLTKHRLKLLSSFHGFNYLAVATQFKKCETYDHWLSFQLLVLGAC